MEIVMTHYHPRAATAGALAAAGCLLLTACGGGSTPSTAKPNTPAANATESIPTSAASAAQPAGAGVDPCSLLTQADVDTAVGESLGTGKSTIPTYDCSWATSDFASGVDIKVSDWPAINAAAHGNGAHPTSITGVGDEALNLNGSNGSLLYVRKGSEGFLLTVNGPKVDTKSDHGLAQEKVLAAAVLGRL
jgi:Protein of unknown function (DUF3558)